MWLTTLALVGFVIVLLLVYSKYRHSYWSRHGVSSPPNTIPFLGHFSMLMSRRIARWKYVDEFYRSNRSSRIWGIYEFLRPIIYIGDPDMAKLICIKDFDHFVNRRNFQFSNKRDEIMNHFLTNAAGEHWKGVRSVLSPSFTSGRMKNMFPLVSQKADALVEYIHKNRDYESSAQLKKTFGKYTLEVIASCAFGMESGAFASDNSFFAAKVDELFQMSAGRLVKFFVFMVAPRLCEFLRITLIQNAMYFFMDVVKDSIHQREQGLHRGDFLDLMLEARKDQKSPNAKTPKYPLTDSNIVANSVLFILAGYDTTANTLSFCAYLLAKHPEIQQRLRDEMQECVREDGELTYQAIMESKFLESCLAETLRMYTPAHFTERQCTKEYKLPGTDIVIPEKMIVAVPIYSIHHDERYWPEPEEFNPDRFMPENKENIKSGTYMPFGLGPRNCIGMRFAQMEAKLAIAKILLDFELKLVPGHEKLEFNLVPGIMRPSDDLKVAFIPLATTG